jgi:hypothetical protein
MRYLLLIYGDEKALEASMEGQTPEETASQMKVWFEYTDWLREKGWYEAGEGLQPTATATTVRNPGDDAVVTDGPFAETKEQLGGYYVINTSNLDEAIEAAKGCPGARFGSIELRPIQEFEDQG